MDADNNRHCGCQHQHVMYQDTNCGCMNQEIENQNCACKERMEELKMQIKQCKFMVNDLALYLDTHPFDRRAVCLHNEHTKHLRELENEYQRLYGPLSICYPCNKWRWIEEPWPWERSDN